MVSVGSMQDARWPRKNWGLKQCAIDSEAPCSPRSAAACLVDRRTGVLVAFAEVQVQCILPLFGCVMTYVDTHIYTRGHAGSARLRLLFAAH